MKFIALFAIPMSLSLKILAPEPILELNPMPEPPLIHIKPITELPFMPAHQICQKWNCNTNSPNQGEQMMMSYNRMLELGLNCCGKIDFRIGGEKSCNDNGHIKIDGEIYEDLGKWNTGVCLGAEGFEQLEDGSWNVYKWCDCRAHWNKPDVGLWWKTKK